MLQSVNGYNIYIIFFKKLFISTRVFYLYILWFYFPLEGLFRKGVNLTFLLKFTNIVIQIFHLKNYVQT